MPSVICALAVSSPISPSAETIAGKFSRLERQGNIPLTDLRSRRRTPTKQLRFPCSIFVIAGTLLLVGCAHTTMRPLRASAAVSAPHAAPSVWGFADLHTHPAVHLAFGADQNGNNGMFWGKPGLELSTSSSEAAIASDLPACAPDSHSGPDADPVRHGTHQALITHLDSMNTWPHGSGGYPDFQSWPASLSLEHQQMHITEIRRAYDGGLRLMIASATDNQLISILWQKIGFNVFGNPIPVPDSSFDYNSAVTQLSFIRNFALANNTWMAIVTTPAEARQAINNNKLAVILSLELDSLSSDQILALVRNYQVRHVIPVHLANSVFGGSAAYDDTFNSNNYFLNGNFYSVTTNKCVSFRLGRPDHLVQGDVGAIVPQPIDAAWFATLGYDTDASLGGHENKTGLNNNEFLNLMRDGLLLDVAHMDEKSANGALTLGEQFGYPIMDSHTGLRDDSNCPASVPAGTNERSLPFSHVKRIANLGGVLGLGTAKNQGPDAVEDWLTDYLSALRLMGGKGVALGTDANGLSPQILNNLKSLQTTYPITVASKFSPPSNVPTPALPKFQLGSRTFDFTTDGIANYGLLPDFLQAVMQHPDSSWSQCESACQQCVQAQCTRIVEGNVAACIQSCEYQNPSPTPTPNPAAIPALTALYHSAEDVIEMWEKVQTAAAKIPPPPRGCTPGEHCCATDAYGNCTSCVPNAKACGPPTCGPHQKFCGTDGNGNPICVASNAQCP